MGEETELSTMKLIGYSYNRDPLRSITEEERLFHDGRYIIDEDKSTREGLIVSKKVWEEMTKEPMLYIRDLDNKGRYFKFTSQTHGEKEKEDDGYTCPEQRAFDKGSNFVIHNKEIKMFKFSPYSLLPQDPFLGYWGDFKQGRDIYVQTE